MATGALARRGMLVQRRRRSRQRRSSPSSRGRSRRSPARRSALRRSVSGSRSWTSRSMGMRADSYPPSRAPYAPTFGLLGARTLDGGEERHVGVDHQPDQLLERRVRLPAKLALGLGGVADEQVYLGRALELVVDDDVVLPVQPRLVERDLDTALDGVGLPGRDHV